ncbi:MAG: type II secretion system protein GspC [Gammaproteobacteria bacterium]|jgi:general secretion pathway protein C|nr:type II secretion system protein GspC [Gammaproteobacteria bacterium]MDP7093805.1 type II secretion system protein GspC [Gammaproteobacteria bacterium]MDP7271627.1 type II secretion system protein GspC [Gammaproteobacteria bacterium]HJP03632.1 type II secretion system protein GspC [Gammaproteobacteria bacterium]
MDLIHKIDLLRAQPPTYWVNAANQHLPAVCSILLVVAIAWYLAKLIWVLVPPANEFDWTVKSTVVAGAGQLSTDVSSATFRTIASAHLFGESGADPAPVVTVNAPETRLNLKLRGTIAAPDDSLAHAIIADGKGQDEVYFIRDRVPGGALLHEVHPDRVILNRGGTLETLKLPKISEAGGRPPIRRASGMPVNRASPAAIAMAQRVQQNPGAFTEILRPQPYMPNGQLKGYRVYPGRDRRRFAAIGLRPGDLVTELNGQSLTNLQDGLEVFKSLGDSPQITVTIERNGNPMVLTLDSTQLAGSDGGLK